MRTLSSGLTFFHKFIFPSFWVGCFAFGTILMFVNPDGFKGNGPDIRDVRLVFLAALVLGTAFIYWSSIRLKQVALEGETLIVSNFRKKIIVPLREVERVSGSLLMHPELVWLHLRNPTEFGTKIMFTPKWRLWGGFTIHPIVGELREYIAAAKPNYS